ncbi:MAG: choice-of-anchor Q domain-containing protein [Planctomycetota bacterium]
MDTSTFYRRAKSLHRARCLRGFESLEDRRLLAVFSVTNGDDAGVGSLRQALIDANNLAGNDTVAFDSGFFSSPQVIGLANPLPTIADDVVITGPGSEFATIDAGHGTDSIAGTGDGFRLLDVDDGNSGATIDVQVSGLTLTGGDVAGAGGAIQSRENLTLSDLAIFDNATGPGVAGVIGGPGQDGGDGGRGGDGGGVFSSGGNLTVIGSTISGNSTGGGGNGGNGGDGADGTNGQNGGDGGNGGNGGYGGGIFTDGGNLVITNSTISGNTTGAGGNSGTGGNGGEADFGGTSGLGGGGGDGGYGGNGGGIYSSVGELTITGSTISGNFTGQGQAGGAGGEGGFGASGGDGGDGGTGGSGGGLYSVEGRLELSMSTVTQNRASAAGSGGVGGLGGFLGSDGSAGYGGGVNSLGNDPFLLDNTIIAGNESAGGAPDLITGTVTLNIDYSIIGIGDGLSITSSVGNQIGTSAAPITPGLGPLASNGSKTLTHALMPGSPALDAGDPSIVFNASEFDQRGAPFSRVEDGDLTAGARIDVGAYEAQSPPSADFDQDGDVDGFDFLSWQRGFGTTTGALLADGNSDDDEDVDASDLAVWTTTYGQSAAPLQSSVAAPVSTETVDTAVAALFAVDEGNDADSVLSSPNADIHAISPATTPQALAVATDYQQSETPGDIEAAESTAATRLAVALADEVFADPF